VNGYLAGFLAILSGIAVAVVGELLSEEIRDRLDQVPRAILRFATRWLGPDQRMTVYRDEWEPELIYILKGAEARPVTRLITGIRYALGILINTRRIARHLHRPAPGRPELAAAGAPGAMAGHRSFWVHGDNFLVALAGAQPEILKLCPHDRVKYQSLGWAILVTGGMASVSMWFALSSAQGLNGIAAVLFALPWGLVILGLDRFLVVSIPVGGSRKFLMAVPRLLLAVLLGLVISTPLVLRIFQPEINGEISVMKDQQTASALQESLAMHLIATQTTAVSNLQKVIDSRGAVAVSLANDLQVRSLTTQLNAELALRQGSYQLWQCLLRGGPGCPAGNGTLAKAAEVTYNQARQGAAFLTSELRQARYQQAVAELPAARQQLKATINRENTLRIRLENQTDATSGLLVRMQTLINLSKGNYILSIVCFLLFLLFAMLQFLAVTVRLLQRPGTYEEAVALKRERLLEVPTSMTFTGC